MKKKCFPVFICTRTALLQIEQGKEGSCTGDLWSFTSELHYAKRIFNVYFNFDHWNTQTQPFTGLRSGTLSNQAYCMRKQRRFMRACLHRHYFLQCCGSFLFRFTDSLYFPILTAPCYFAQPCVTSSNDSNARLKSSTVSLCCF